MEDKIKKQVEEQPLTRDESREQFERITEQLGLKHSFDFEEAWEIGLEIRKRKEFREKISELEEAITTADEGMTGDVLNKANPVKHTFADGCYIREIYNPPNQILITKIHKKEHPFFLMKGAMSILTEEGVQHIEAPYQGITKPGTKRVIYTHTECVFTTVHATENTTVEDVESEVVCTKYEDLPSDCDALEILKKINLKEE
tara:strand:- start:325 stop:930 length:606 start_codon:yes stop_codon:yes gene_type:complete